MKSRTHDGEAADYRLPQRAWRELREVESQLEFLAALFARPSSGDAGLRQRLEDPSRLALCLRALAQRLGQVGSQARPLTRDGEPTPR